MNYRIAAKNDLPQLSILFDGYRVFYRKNSDATAAHAFLNERFENKDSVIFVAEDSNGTLLGFTQLYPIFSSTRMQKAWLLNDLFVNSEARGKGISKGLIEKAKDLARATGAYGFFLETEKSNEIGNKLYPSVGMRLNSGSNYYEWTV